MTGGGGNVGAVVAQLVFFRGSRFSSETGISLMGAVIIACTFSVAFIFFPQWGGMLCGPRKGCLAEDYYAAEWSEEEKSKGFHLQSLKFAENTRSERATAGASRTINDGII
ncbi:High affinity nitrate transporter 2.5 [Apostasia shenzhenica]|uniref:High affinity nitrate transporter 2.5 n=1 Tax=Apostasia shenzhenica TaxID=1088818 RepID=A0A2I0AJ10_9ASPA|nr:High affinity nitrate transporter 2.5 [Apostasia shenzhenica]